MLGWLWAALSVATTLAWLAGRLTAFEHAYARHMAALAADAWMHGQCQDPAFAEAMRRHQADVCARVALAYARSAWAAGLEGAAPEELVWLAAALYAHRWAVAAALGVVAVAGPALALPRYRAHADAWERRVVLARSSRKGAVLLPVAADMAGRCM